MIGLSTSTYYYRPKRPRLDRERDDAELCDKIERLQSTYSCWGYRTIAVQLMRQHGMRVNHKRVLRVMRKYRLFRRQKRHFCATTDSNHPFHVYKNLIRGMAVVRVNQLWVSDITYIRIVSGFVFLATVLDVYSRRIVGYAIGKRITHDLTCEALRSAINARHPEAGIIHHSDRGVQYCCAEYVTMLKDNGFQVSMSQRGNPYHNAYAESFFKTLKHEEVYLWQYESFTDVVDRMRTFIEDVYNRKRVHSALGYLPPVEFECIFKNEGQATIISDC